jgi:hypothetical protein
VSEKNVGAANWSAPIVGKETEPPASRDGECSRTFLYLLSSRNIPQFLERPRFDVAQRTRTHACATSPLDIGRSSVSAPNRDRKGAGIFRRFDTSLRREKGTTFRYISKPPPGQAKEIWAGAPVRAPAPPASCGSAEPHGRPSRRQDGLRRRAKPYRISWLRRRMLARRLSVPLCVPSANPWLINKPLNRWHSRRRLCAALHPPLLPNP